MTAVERWLYLALACNEALLANAWDPERFTVLYKRPTDLALHMDVPVCCNLLVCDILDEGEVAGELHLATQTQLYPDRE